MRLAWRLNDRADPWECVEATLPPQFFGHGSQRDFAWYLTGESGVPVRSFEEICKFLLGCAYVRDPVLFQVPDFWQHPITFEQIRGAIAKITRCGPGGSCATWATPPTW